MKKDLKFSEFPFVVPNAKTISLKLESLLNELKSAKSAKDCLLVIKKWNKYSEKIQTQFSIVSTNYSLDTQNKKFVKAQEKCDETSPIISKYNNEYCKILVSSPFRKELEDKLGVYLFKMYDAVLKSFDECIMEDLVEENKLASQYSAILGSAEVDFRGEKLNLSQLGKYIQDSDRATRKEAAQLFSKWIGEHNDAIGEIYSKLVLLRDKMAKKLGYKNYIPLAYLKLGRTDYNAEMVAGYRKQIAENVVPICNSLYKTQMKNLGIKNPQYYDYALKFKNGNAMPAGDCKYLINAASNMYSNLSSETKEYFDFMMSHELLDLEARKGKAPGGYCTYFPLYKAPFIFSNFNGTDGDINVLTHEGGHAFQGYMCRNIKIPEYMNPTLESCEIHSMSMEFFAWPYMDGFAKKDAEKYKYAHLADAIEFLPYGITVDEFQHWVYENPTATHQQRCDKWREIEKRYTPHKKYDDTPAFENGELWIRQSHIIEVPFYYIDYTLAQVVAFQFLAEDRKDHVKAWKKYVKLCKCGGKYPFTKLLEKNHLRNPFIDGNVKKNIKPLIKVLKEFDTSKF